MEDKNKKQFLKFKNFQKILSLIDEKDFLIEMLRDVSQESSNLRINLEKKNYLIIYYYGYFKTLQFNLSDIQENTYGIGSAYNRKYNNAFDDIMIELELDTLSNISMNFGLESKYYFVAKTYKKELNALTLEIPLDRLVMISCGTWGMYESYEEIENIKKRFFPSEEINQNLHINL